MALAESRKWGEKILYQESYYFILANSSEVKVVLQRATASADRWIDQGAVQALAMHACAAFAIAALKWIFKQHVWNRSKKTNWR